MGTHGINSDAPNSQQSPLIFLVDDERLVGDLAEIILRERGYSTRLFDDPQRLLDVFIELDTKPALLITDYVMGEMNGLELISACRAVHPSLKAIMVSGTVELDFIARQPVQPDAFLSKPYDGDRLIEMVKKFLAEK